MEQLKLKNVSKCFHTQNGTVHAVKDVSLGIQSGSIYGIIGSSGAGKSTLVRCFNYLEKPSSGSVWIEGRNLEEMTEKELREQRQDIAMIFQHFNLLMQKNVIDNVCFPLLIQGIKKKQAREKARELLKLVGLSDKERVYPAQLSGGQMQRVAIARALASEPKILLCDEATSALDPNTTASILALLKDINERLGITIVIITHQMSVIRQVCTHVGIMHDGELVESGVVQEVLEYPQTMPAKILIFGDNDLRAGKYDNRKDRDKTEGNGRYLICGTMK